MASIDRAYSRRDNHAGTSQQERFTSQEVFGDHNQALFKVIRKDGKRC
jgi:hypothetical protein